MLVAGSRGAGLFSALVLGSASRYAATHGRCPVIVERQGPA
jgi:nucleotide-binding universal stress UspA family protein